MEFHTSHITNQTVYLVTWQVLSMIVNAAKCTYRELEQDQYNFWTWRHLVKHEEIMLSWMKFGPQLETMLSTIGDGINMHAISSLIASQENIRCDVDENLWCVMRTATSKEVVKLHLYLHRNFLVFCLCFCITEYYANFLFTLIYGSYLLCVNNRYNFLGSIVCSGERLSKPIKF